MKKNMLVIKELKNDLGVIWKTSEAIEYKMVLK